MEQQDCIRPNWTVPQNPSSLDSFLLVWVQIPRGGLDHIGRLAFVAYGQIYCSLGLCMPNPNGRGTVTSLLAMSIKLECHCAPSIMVSILWAMVSKTSSHAGYRNKARDGHSSRVGKTMDHDW
jgi:hypothetical protein